VRCEGRQSNARSVILTEGHETVEFKMHFQHWPKNAVPKLYEAGREKVAGAWTLVILCINWFR
jgi:hypothetical protein